MKKSTYFIMGCLLSISIMVVPFVFEIADVYRGFDATGGEVFTIALPLMLVWKIVSTAEQNENWYKKKIKKMQEQLEEQKNL